MAQVILLGELGEKFGHKHRFNVRSPAEAVRALDANFKNFRGYLLESAQNNVAYKIIVGDEELQDIAHIRYPSGRQKITFVPMIAGAGGKGFAIGEILVAVAIVVSSFFTFGATGALALGLTAAEAAEGASIAVGLALSLALGGISQLLAPQPKTPQNNNNNTVSSYVFNGPVNVTAQGAPVPVGYGRMIVGSALISGGISTDPLPASLTPISGVQEFLVPSPDLTATNPQTGQFGGLISQPDVTLGKNAVLTPEIDDEGNLKNIVIVNGGVGYHFPVAVVQDSHGNSASITLSVTNGVITTFAIQSQTAALDPNTTVIAIEDSLTGGSGGGGGKGGANAASAATQDPTTLQSHAYASFVDLVCEGEIGGLVNGAQSIFIDGTPLQNADGSFNFAGLAVYFTNGSQSQPVLPEVGSRVQNEQLVNTQVFHGVPIIRTITDETVTSVRVTLEFPQITFQDPSNGDVHGSSVEIAIDVQTDGAGYAQVVDDTISGLCTSPYQRSYIFPLSGNPPWDIRVRRITPDPLTLNTQNLTYFESYTEIIDTNLRYVNSAIAGVMVDSAQFQSIPVRSYDCYLLKVRVPSNYDPLARSYAGIWDGTFKIAWTDNPAWAFYDMLVSERYGLGQYVSIDQVDKWALYQIAKYCDEFIPDGFGGLRPRFTCNIYFQQQADAYKVIQDLASIFRSVAFWSSAAISARQDSPSDPVYVFSPSNVTPDLFTYAGPSAKAKHTVAYVTWNDPNNQYQQAVEYVEDQAAVKKYGIIPASVTAIGVTNRGQAHNVGKWLLYVEQNESETVQFKTGVEGSGVVPGSIILVSDPTRAGERFGGRTHDSDDNSITIDDDYTPANGSVIGAILPDGSYEETSIIDQAGRRFSVSPPWSTPPAKQAQWVITQPNLVPQQFRVLSITDTVAKDGMMAIVAIKHNPNKYDAIEDDLPLEPLKVINFNAPVVAPTNTTLIEQLYVLNNQIKSQVIISWTATSNTVKYSVSYAKDGGNDFTLPDQNSPSIVIKGLDPGAYVFKLIGKNILGNSSQPVIINYNVLGNALPPADVVNYQVTEEVSDLLLTWNPNADVDLSGYEIREGVSWDSGDVLITNYSGTSFKTRPTAAGTYKYHIRAISTGGTYSENVATVIITLLAPAPVSQFNVIQNNASIQFAWLKNPEPDITGYEIREGTSWAISTLIVQVLATTYAMPVGNAAARTFWIKAIRQPGIYSDTAEFSTTTTAAIPNMNEVVSTDQQALSWPGLMILCHTSSGDLIMDDNVSRSEYIFAVSLGADYNGINTMAYTLAAVLDDTLTWTGATFDWNAPNAGRQWLPSGDVTSVSTRPQIARQIGLMAGEIDGWGCDTTVSVNSVSAGHATGVTYEAGRYNNGIHVTDFTTVDWPVSVPSTFSAVFWFEPDEVIDAVLWSVSGGSGSLRVGYSVARNLFYLRDSAGSEVTLPFSFSAGDLLFFGVSQDSVNRALFIGNLAGDVANASAAIAPLGTYSNINLHA